MADEKHLPRPGIEHRGGYTGSVPASQMGPPAKIPSGASFVTERRKRKKT